MKSVLRIIVGLIFIASGFVKAVDVVGFSFKLEEYFSPTVFNLPFFEKYALVLAIIVVVLELVLGTLLLLKIRLKNTLLALIALCIFFAFLTFYSAYFDKVTDCGCFGDAIKFTPWQSFTKDIILLFVLIILWFLYRKEFSKNERNTSLRLWVLAFSIAATVFVVAFGIYDEPLIDFRNYKVGTDLNSEKKKIKENPSEYKTFYSLKNSKTGETIKVNQDDYVNNAKYWEEGTPWSIDTAKNESVLTKEGYHSEIEKFEIEDASGFRLTEEILNSPKAILIFSYHPEKADPNILKQAEEKAKNQKDALVLGVSTNPSTFKLIKNTVMDGTAIKTIARSNPFVLVLKNGVITEKMPATSFIKNP